jgi:chemotaxis protein MotB
MSGKDRKANRGNVVIRKEEIVEGGHHGGAWKVAYADFVTAMMAFFLLMWLLNATTETQRVGLADYFTPSNLFSHESSGSGQPFGGHTPYDHGQMVSDRGVQTAQPGNKPPMTQPPAPPNTRPPDQLQPSAAASDGGQTDQDAAATGNAETEQRQTGIKAPGGGQAAAQAQTPSPSPARFLANAAATPTKPPVPDDAARRAELDHNERAAFDAAASEIREAVRDDPQLADLMQQLAIDQTPEGLRIQLLDEDKQPMFATGSATPNDRAQRLLQKIAAVLIKLPEAISIAGHTDAAPYKGSGMSNWELSTERANATRRLLEQAGLQQGRVRSVTGNADRDPLLPADPMAAANRRIAILVLRAARGGS